jgi:hypothetical protein
MRVRSVTLPLSHGCMQLIEKWVSLSGLFGLVKERVDSRHDLVSMECVPRLDVSFLSRQKKQADYLARWCVLLEQTPNVTPQSWSFFSSFFCNFVKMWM